MFEDCGDDGLDQLTEMSDDVTTAGMDDEDDKKPGPLQVRPTRTTPGKNDHMGQDHSR